MGLSVVGVNKRLSAHKEVDVLDQSLLLDWYSVCDIESAETEKVMSFFETFPHLINDFTTPSSWNPLMFAIRYGNKRLIEYFRHKGMDLTIENLFHQATLIHAAIYSGDSSVLQYTLDMGLSPNPLKSESPPIKIAMKINNVKMVELLVTRGAYYVYSDVENNIEKSNAPEEANKFYVLGTKREVSAANIAEDTTIRECPIKETLRWARIKPLMHLYSHAKVHKSKNCVEGHPFDALTEILVNEVNLNSILKVCIGKGDSILCNSDVVESDKSAVK